MKRILMVDDVSTNLICASEVLKSSYEIITAKSGSQALAILQETTPDLILLDVVMPDMDGYEVFQKIKDMPKAHDIPVIFLTAEQDQQKELKGFEMGAMDFIRKPFEPEIMRSRIDKILKMTEENRALRNIAHKDELTKLQNRRCLEKYINEDHPEMPGYFLLMDLDNFKLVNDTYGHIIGDDVLVRLAGVLEEEVGEEDCACRLGGDEFAVFVSGKYTTSEIRTMVRRIIAGCEFEISELLAEATDFKVSMSVGIAKKPEDGADFMTLYANADKALYYVKQNGKRGYHFYHDANNEDINLAKENQLIDLLQLQRLIQEKEDVKGAYQVEYNGFKRIYHFVARCMERKAQDVQLVLFTIKTMQEHLLGEDNIYIQSLEEAVSKLLRRGDVATKCGSAQYVVILMDASEQNGEMVAKRITQKFNDLIQDDQIQLYHEMQSIKSGAKI